MLFCRAYTALHKQILAEFYRDGDDAAYYDSDGNLDFGPYHTASECIGCALQWISPPHCARAAASKRWFGGGKRITFFIRADGVVMEINAVGLSEREEKLLDAFSDMHFDFPRTVSERGPLSPQNILRMHGMKGMKCRLFCTVSQECRTATRMPSWTIYFAWGHTAILPTGMAERDMIKSKIILRSNIIGESLRASAKFCRRIPNTKRAKSIKRRYRRSSVP